MITFPKGMILSLWIIFLAQISLAEVQVFKSLKGYSIVLPTCWTIEVNGPHDGTEDLKNEANLHFSSRNCKLPSEQSGGGISIGIYPEKRDRAALESDFKIRTRSDNKSYIHFKVLPGKNFITNVVEKFSDPRKPRFRWRMSRYCEMKVIEIVGNFRSEETPTDEAVLKKIEQKNFDIPAETQKILDTIKCNP